MIVMLMVLTPEEALKLAEKVFSPLAERELVAQGDAADRKPTRQGVESGG